MTGLSSASSPDPAIWICRQGEIETTDLPDWLSETERSTVSLFSGPRRREYLASRWLLRQAIAGASGKDAAVCRPVPGRPIESQHPTGWRLSLSHSNGLCACATSSVGVIGLDIEPAERHPQWQKVVKRWFTAHEQAWLLGRNQPDQFLTVWTLKEAWLKATGRGIAGNLQTLEVSPDFRLAGDQSEPDWYASCSRVGNFLVTLVFRTAGAATPPVIRLLPEPPGSLELAPASADTQLVKPLVFTAITRRSD
ncbi:4'-phosphopantetheinyl transferase superfamily protein [Marinobacter salinexigens]|uniref:4'-phosphopantetheinyl transferase superfamily protein n=1 Tax=Marinobacter salinexigens TaxID=2919747 RepID=A0A5B0VI11_9GAMM|nr:4'-phosphopantetheinyl transferase superfamily protein [Marinobacter salinexigens]KAA1174262.1 4'-phosphopantetheinyl transferase superfamily protein [Marinobacter salinexigens]